MPDQITYQRHGVTDVSIGNSNIRSLILEAKYCRDLTLLMAQDETLAYNQMNWYLGCRTMACVGKTTNHYLDSRLLMEKQEMIDRAGAGAARTEAYVSLALLYMLRCEAKMNTFQIGDKDAIFRADPLIRKQMRGLLESIRKRQSSRAKLFALFVGAYAEQASAVTTPGAPERSWFNVNVVTQSAQLGLWTWKEIREVLIGFHYSDALQPQGSNWFWKTMKVNIKPSSSSRLQTGDSTHGTDRL